MNDITRRDTTRDAPETRAPERDNGRALQPPVDIHEEGNALHLIADMPGVASDTLSIEVDNNVLSLEGEVRLDLPEGMSAIYAEVQAKRFARRFTLSHEIDAEAIEARLDNGLLHLLLPKKQSHQRRRIEVRAT